MIKNIDKTAWAKEFKKECKGSYDEAVKLINTPGFEVVIERRHEPLDIRGRQVTSQWAIVASIPGEGTSEDFWLDAFHTKADCIKRCKAMKWPFKVSRTSTSSCDIEKGSAKLDSQKAKKDEDMDKIHEGMLLHGNNFAAGYKYRDAEVDLQRKQIEELTSSLEDTRKKLKGANDLLTTLWYGNRTIFEV